VSGADLVVRTASPEGTRAVGRALAGLLQPGDLLVLAGDLGAGKTTFAQGVGQGLGVSDPVVSPTFTLVRQYRCGAGAPVRTLLHADLYRLDQLAEVLDLDLAELVEDQAAALVEWGDLASEVLGPEQVTLVLQPTADEDARELALWLPPSWAGRRDALVAALGGLGLLAAAGEER
jgi:tRNA threonylcarbamoyladenosine biosynthesis protein TsaE